MQNAGKLTFWGPSSWDIVTGQGCRSTWKISPPFPFPRRPQKFQVIFGKGLVAPATFSLGFAFFKAGGVEAGATTSLRFAGCNKKKWRVS